MNILILFLECIGCVRFEGVGRLANRSGWIARKRLLMARRKGPSSPALAWLIVLSVAVLTCE